MEEIKQIIKPENKIEELIINDPYFITGALWGEPREGHPEGKVIYHIREVLDNVDKYSNSDNRADLRLIAIVHDTFKNNVDLTKPKSGENHHGMIARRFAEKYVNNKHVLDIIELHDEAFNCWQKGNRDGKWDKAQERLNKFLEKDLDFTLYTIFYQCDNETGDKSQECIQWFKDLLTTKD